MLYAIGEIVLVVIGILIAVSINNWNQRKKEAEVEKEILQQIKQDLLLSVKDIESNIDWFDQAIESSHLILEHMDRGAPYADSIGEHFTKAFPWVILVIDLGGYESVKSEGIDILRNDTIKNQVINLLEGRLYYHRQFENIISKQSEHIFREVGNKYFKSYAKGWERTKDQIYLGITEPHDYQLLRIDHEFRFFVETQIALLTAFQIGSNYRMRNAMGSIIEQIDNEVKPIN